MKRLWWLLFVACLLFADHHAATAQQGNQKARLFDSYGAIPTDDAGARLDNFVIQLQNEPNVDGYMIVYGPGGEGSGAGQRVLDVMRDYLINIRGLDPERIQAVYGGRYQVQSQVLLQLWLVPRGTPPPQPTRYKSRIKTITGKFISYRSWDGFADGGYDGPPFGNVTLAAVADVLREQPKASAYFVSFNVRGASPGTWRRVAKRDAATLQSYGIEAERIKIIYGGIAKREKDEDAQSSKVEIWIQPSDAPPPVKEANPERTPSKAVLISSFDNFRLRYREDERWIFEGFADVLRANEQLSVCLIARLRNAEREPSTEPDEPPDIDTLKLVEQWKSELTEKLGIKESRIVIIPADAGEYSDGAIEVWVVPPGEPLPDPYASDTDESSQN